MKTHLHPSREALEILYGRIDVVLSGGDPQDPQLDFRTIGKGYLEENIQPRSDKHQTVPAALGIRALGAEVFPAYKHR